MKGWTITGVVALLGAIALNGTELLAFARGTWLFLVSLSATAPLGLSSFLLALALGVASRPFLLRYMPDLRCHASREFVIDLLALVTGVGVMVAQLRELNGVLLGLLAGFAAPLVARGISAAWGLVFNREPIKPGGTD